MRAARKPSAGLTTLAGLQTGYSSPARPKVFEAHDVILAKIVAQLNFNDYEFDVAAVSQAMIGFGRDVDVLTFS